MTTCKTKAPEYSMNEVVILKNLENRPDINGFRGKVVHVGDYGFYQIEIMTGSERELLNVGGENLEKFGFDALPNQDSFGFKTPCFIRSANAGGAKLVAYKSEDQKFELFNSQLLRRQRAAAMATP